MKWADLKKGESYTQANTCEYLGEFKKAIHNVDEHAVTITFKLDNSDVERMFPDTHIPNFSKVKTVRWDKLIPGHTYVSPISGDIFGKFVRAYTSSGNAYAVFKINGTEHTFIDIEGSPFHEIPSPNKSRKRQRNRNKEDLTCSICTEMYVNPHTLGCSHNFCKTCIQKWREQKDTCPICRKKITSMTPNPGLARNVANHT